MAGIGAAADAAVFEPEGEGLICVGVVSRFKTRLTGGV